MLPSADTLLSLCADWDRIDIWICVVAVVAAAGSCVLGSCCRCEDKFSLDNINRHKVELRVGGFQFIMVVDEKTDSGQAILKRDNIGAP